MKESVIVRPSDRLREVAQPVWDAIAVHPYIIELKNGTLPEATFRFYVQQDWLDFYAPSREGFSPRIAAIQELFDKVADTADPATLARCERNYVISSRYEWWFWDTAYNRVTWRPPL